MQGANKVSEGLWKAANRANLFSATEGPSAGDFEMILGQIVGPEKSVERFLIQSICFQWAIMVRRASQEED
jgi:hypothetical protein